VLVFLLNPEKNLAQIRLERKRENAFRAKTQKPLEGELERK